MAGYQGTYEDLEDMILRYQYFLTCDKSLQTFLKEKGKMSLKDMCKASNDYYDAHGYPSDKHEHKDKRNGPNKAYNQYKGNGTQINSGPHKAALHCDNCGLNNHNTSECRKPRGRASNNDIVCFACNKTGHKRSQCPTNKVTHRAAAMQQVNSERSHGGHWSPTRPHQCDNVQNEGQIKLACECMLPVVAGALSPNGQNVLKDWQLQMTPCCKRQVNDIVTMVL